MAQDASTFVDAPVERRPGDFQRSKTGIPYVSDPGGALVKPKRKSDEPRVKMLAYGRPSGFGKQIESTYNLQKWSERTVALGLGIDYTMACESLAVPGLVARAATLAGRDRDDQVWRSDADGIVTEAKQVAKGGIAADRGTHAHALTEEDDQERDWIVLAERGEIVGLDVDVQRSLVVAWREMLERDGLQVLATEAACVHDGYRMAGTLDRIARLGRSLRFTLITGEIVELSDGLVIVLDIKSGKHRVDPKGVAMYWQSYAVQIATYAGGVPYDTDTEQRGAWPWPIEQRWGLIAHLDVLGAIAGTPSCTLVLVDLEAGRTAAELCLAAKAWEKRSDVFSIDQISETTPVVVADEQAPPDEPPAVPPTMQELHARLRVHPDIDEGTVADPAGLDVAFARLAEHWLGLDVATKSWAGQLQTEAQQHNCGFHAREAHTLRRFELIRGLMSLGAAGLDDSELVRYVIHHVTGDDVALFPTIAVGHALGALDAAEAQRFAAVCDELVAGLLVLTFTNDGVPRLIARAA